MTDLHARVLARLDEVEAVAKAAAPGTWMLVPEGADPDAPTPYVRTAERWPLLLSETDSEADLAHVATWGPAAVLRLVAGLRRIAERHQVIDTDSTGDGPRLRCAGHLMVHGIAVWPCDDIQDLAVALGVDGG